MYSLPLSIHSIIVAFYKDSLMSSSYSKQPLSITMKNYMIIYHAPADAFKEVPEMTPEQKMEGMKPWMDWKESIGDALVDFGSPLIGGVRLSPDGSFSTSTKEVAGYSIVQAVDMEGAKQLLMGHPHLAWNEGCDIEIHEYAPM